MSLKSSAWSRGFLLATAGLAMALLTFAAGAAPQEAPPEPEDPAAAPQAAPDAPAAELDLSDAKLQAVARAYLQVVEIHEEYGPRIEAAATQEEAVALEQEANEQMVEVIDSEEGVTVEEYARIITLVQTDEELRDRLLVHIERERG